MSCIRFPHILSYLIQQARESAVFSKYSSPEPLKDYSGWNKDQAQVTEEGDVATRSCSGTYVKFQALNQTPSTQSPLLPCAPEALRWPLTKSARSSPTTVRQPRPRLDGSGLEAFSSSFRTGFRRAGPLEADFRDGSKPETLMSCALG